MLKYHCEKGWKGRERGTEGRDSKGKIRTLEAS